MPGATGEAEAVRLQSGDRDEQPVSILIALRVLVAELDERLPPDVRLASRCPRPLGGPVPRHRPRARPAIPYSCLYFAAITSLEFMSMVRVHPEVPLNSNGAGFGPRR